jgi:hypothetical protein
MTAVAIASLAVGVDVVNARDCGRERSAIGIVAAEGSSSVSPAETPVIRNVKSSVGSSVVSNLMGTVTVAATGPEGSAGRSTEPAVGRKSASPAVPGSVVYCTVTGFAPEETIVTGTEPELSVVG